jgi:CheY-like chemotaxis protein
MPVMDGYTATRAIRSNPAFAQLPILAMTANAMAGDREKVLEAGMWDHIAKPLNVNDMFATIAKWIKPARSASAANGLPAAPAAVVAANVPATAADPAMAQAALQRLVTLLKDGDLEAAEAVDDLQALIEGTPMAFAIKRVASAVSDCDFDAALAALEQAGL